MNTKINFAGIEMKNPVTVASGTFGYGREFNEFFDLSKLGGHGEVDGQRHNMIFVTDVYVV